MGAPVGCCVRSDRCRLISVARRLLWLRDHCRLFTGLAPHRCCLFPGAGPDSTGPLRPSWSIHEVSTRSLMNAQPYPRAQAHPSPPRPQAWEQELVTIRPQHHRPHSVREAMDGLTLFPFV